MPVPTRTKEMLYTREVPKVPMAFEITTTRRFSAAHQLRLYDGSLEAVHGHNWRVKVTVGSTGVDSIGVVMDFHELERLADAVLRPLHNRNLNEVPPFTSMNPSAENVARHVGEAISKSHLPAGVALLSAEVWETDENSAVYRP
jgi:6-pyruvoyltetrahydropterin/6-carboxytetrahydropterin synthase